jgi:3-carboxy-cis,cis-muconate cycloisomerase
LAEAVSLLGLVTGSLGKIAYDVMLMASTELAEVYEPLKRNPISSELMLAAAKAVRQHVGLMLDAMIQDFERATGPWHAEWIALPDSFVLSAGALHQAKFMLGGLIVDDRAVNEQGGRLVDVLAGDPEVASHLERSEIERLTDPANYLGSAPAMVDRLLAGRSRI